MDHIPNEILLQIFEHLTYWDLRLRVPLVSRRFRGLLCTKTKSGTLDRMLFRDQPDDRLFLSPKTIFYAHPIFTPARNDSIQGKLAVPGRHVPFLEPPYDPEELLLPVLSENALSPAVSRLVISDDYPISHSHANCSVVTNTIEGEAVTVADVLRGVIDILVKQGLIRATDRLLPVIHTRNIGMPRLGLVADLSVERRAIVGEDYGCYLICEEGADVKDGEVRFVVCPLATLLSSKWWPNLPNYWG